MGKTIKSIYLTLILISTYLAPILYIDVRNISKQNDNLIKTKCSRVNDYEIKVDTSVVPNFKEYHIVYNVILYDNITCYWNICSLGVKYYNENICYKANFRKKEIYLHKKKITSNMSRKLMIFSGVFVLSLPFLIIEL